MLASSVKLLPGSPEAIDSSRAAVPIAGERAGHHYGLDLLRLTAALLVIADHFSLFGWRVATAQAQPQDVAYPVLHSMSSIGSVGVEIFFLISGFVISQSALRDSALSFGLKRAIRILPALWICAMLALAARLSLGEPIGTLSLAFLKSISLSPMGPYIDGVVWTLVVEAVFYAAVVGCLLTPSILNLRRLAYLLTVCSGAFVLVMFCANSGWLGVAPSRHLLAVMDRFPFKVFLLRDGVFFAAGIMIWDNFRIEVTLRRKSLLAITLLLCSLEICILRIGVWEIMGSIASWWFALCALIASVHYSDPIKRSLGQLKSKITFLGNLSYPIYLTHYTVGYVLVYQLSIRGLSHTQVLVLSLVTIFVLSSLVALGPEPAAQRVLRRMLRRQL